MQMIRQTSETAYFGDQVIDQRSKVAAVPGNYDGGCLLCTPGCIDACTQQPSPFDSSNNNDNKTSNITTTIIIIVVINNNKTLS